MSGEKMKYFAYLLKNFLVLVMSEGKKSGFFILDIDNSILSEDSSNK